MLYHSFHVPRVVFLISLFYAILLSRLYLVKTAVPSIRFKSPEEAQEALTPRKKAKEVSDTPMDHRERRSVLRGAMVER
jgi:hypothetical protein